MSLLKKIGIGVMVVLLLLIALVAFLVGTTTGLHLLLNGAARWVPGLQIASVEGGWRNLILKEVSYTMPGVTVNAGQFNLALDPGCLLHSRLCVNTLSAENVVVAVDTHALPPSEPTPAPSPPLTDLNAPFPIELRRLTLNNIQLKVDDTAVFLGELSTGAQWQQRALTLLPTRLSGLVVALTPSSDGEEPADGAAAQASQAAQQAVKQVVNAAQQTDGERAAAVAQAAPTSLGDTLQDLFSRPLLPALPDFRLPLDISIPDFEARQMTLSGGQEGQISILQLQASSQAQALTLDKLVVQSPQGSLYASGHALLSDNWPVSLQANGALNVEPVRGEKLKLTLDGGLRERLNLALNLSGPLKAQLDAHAQLAQAGLPLDVTLQSPQLRWPLTGTAQYQASGLNLRLNGQATDYTLALRGDVRGSDLPPATLQLDGKGNTQQFSLTRLRVSALQGNTDLSGLVDWSKAVSWRGQLTLSGINTARQWPEWPARLDGKITTTGSVYGGSWQLRVPELRLDGNVKQNKVTARGELRGNAAGQWQIPGLDLTLGRNKLSVSGQLSDKWQLDAAIDAPSLDGTLPGLGGTAKGTLKLRGELSAPQLLADITASGLRWQDLSVRRVSVNGDVQSAQQVQGKLAVRIEQVKQGDLDLSLITLDASGSEKQHQLKLALQGEPVAGQLALNGSFDRAQQRWRGTLNDTRVDTPAGEWSQTRAIALDYLNAQQKVTIGPHCWRNPNAELCVPKAIEAGPGGQASVVLNRFDLAMLKPFLTDDTQLSGSFSGAADVSWQANGGLPQAKVRLAGSGVKIQQRVQGNMLPVAFDTLTLNAELGRAGARLDWLMAISGNGRFNGNVLIADPQGRRNLSGNIAIDNISLALLNPALQQGEKAAGILNASLRLGGNVERPQLFGRLALERFDIDGNWMPVDLNNGQLAINFNGMSSTLEGILRTTTGQLNLSGDADWTRPEAWRASVAAKGDRIRVTVPPMVRLDVSPDIRFDASPQLFALNGSVNIPWARIVVKEMPESAVDVSSDEVMLDEQRRPLETKSAGIPINSNLTINIGDDVRLDAFGLQARLNGALKMVQDERGLGLNGQINIPSGRFHAYGQDLIVRKGQILFSGSPEQPMLNFEAIRNPDSTEDDVTAGVRVTGLATAPSLDVFSDPTMSQQEALSYLLRGQGLDSSGTDSSMMTSMLIGLGVAQSGQVVGKIGEAFGVSNLALDTQGAGDSSQVVVSGYVLPGLQVKYGIGIFDSLATLTLRYRLMPKLYLEAVSGIDQALDLLYQFEF
ncbi:translocation/assembly module TamB [Affinibrenneria salicis]|uniref:Translocation/assembly module TamB n=1 Tax=Affinibrenneria salicis TaxID=2590031 RepID=A0A5J5FVR9_9GAMM|nr:translocation/assembly module TamB domain-containing protein [Affinibrenneria salicis]KAA8997717.1 translocation/assembly module TamB [Affinibrenneria salicis]